MNKKTRELVLVYVALLILAMAQGLLIYAINTSI